VRPASLLAALALAGLLCDGRLGAAESKRIEDRAFLNVSFDAPAGWTVSQRSSVVNLLAPSPTHTTISVGYYEPHNSAGYQSWPRWIADRIGSVSRNGTVRLRRKLMVGGLPAVQFEWTEKGPMEGEWNLETNIARPEPSNPRTGEVFVVFMDGSQQPGARQVYDRLLASMRFLPPPGAAQP
jgi:hypothetical protein